MPARALLLFCGLMLFQTGCAVRSPAITQFGAIGDGKTLNTRAIQSAIDHLHASGGGTLLVPPGTFVSGALFFKPGVNLCVQAGGILKGSTNPDDYPRINTRWEGEERPWTSAFLNFLNMNNVVVDGQGTIDGSGDIWMRRGGFGYARRTTTRPATFPALRRGRPRLICFDDCQNVRICDLHLQKQAVWCLHILYCRDVDVNNLTIDAVARIPSSDGIDVDSSRDVRISHCDISCNDDDITIKSGKDADGARVNRPSENITISDCTIRGGGGIAIGSEVTGSVRHVLVQRCVFNGTDASARFKSQPSRGGVIDDVVFKDLTLNNTRWAFDFNLAWRLVGLVRPPAKAPTLTRNVRLINIHGTARSGGMLYGLANGPLRDVSFQNCDIRAQSGLEIRNTADIDFSGLQLVVQHGPPIIRLTTLQPAP